MTILLKAGLILISLGLCVAPTYARDAGVEGAEYHVLAAELAGQRGQMGLAAREYLKALRIAPSADLAERATQVAAYAGDATLAFEAASTWLEMEPQRLEPRIVLLRVALTLGEVQAAIDHSLYIVDHHPKSKAQAFADISHALAADKVHADSALAVMAGLREEYEDNADLEYATGWLALKMEQYPDAAEAATRALALKDEWPEAQLLKATALLAQDQIEQAVAVVNGADLDSDQQIKLHLAFARLLLQSELAAPAKAQYARVLQLDDEQPEALYATAVLQLNEGDEEAAYENFKTLFDEVDAKKDIAAYYLGGIEENRGNFAKALEWYDQVTEGDRYLDAAQRKAFVLYKMDDLEAARAGLAVLRESQPDLAVQLYLVEGELLYEARQFSEAMALYNQGLLEAPDNLDLLYGRSLIAERMGHLTLSERDLRRILELEPDDARSLNALGYILSNHTERYEEALELISKALAQTPDDAAVIDSMGWVQFRLGDLDTALDYLSRAFDLLPDPEVAAHLGEVLWELGRQQQAQEIFEQALQDDPDNPVLRDTIKRLIR